MDAIDRRKETRVNVIIPTPINKIVVNNREITSPHKAFPATIINISTRGVLLQSPLSVPLNLKFFFDLIDEKTKILCFLEIIRKESYEDGYQYGCKLKTVFESDKERLRVFVLKKQVLKLKCMENYMREDVV
jgi:hypothetical protein